MQWETADPRPEPPKLRRAMKFGDLELSVSEARDSNQRWQYLSLTMGMFTVESVEAAMESWPRDALSLARQQLDAFEAALDEFEATREQNAFADEHF